MISPDVGSVLPPAASADGPRSRRALLAGLVGGAGALLAGAIGRVHPTRAAAGDNLKLGQTNYAGSAATRLNASSSGGAFWMTQNGSGSGVRGEASIGTGGIFVTHAPNHHALVAQHQATTGGSGAALRADGAQNDGISASTSNTGQYAHGITAEAPDGFGVVGASATGYGVAGTSDSWTGVWAVCTSGTGLYAQSSSGFGLNGFSTSSYGIYARNGNGLSYAGYFDGNINVTGSIDSAAIASRIDHPLAPATKVLQHAVVASPEMKNIYDGIVTTDAKGEAAVTMPTWFEALNGDYRYQLTPIGNWTEAWIASELADGHFTIASRQPKARIAWQITGIRKDAWAEAHRLDVELEKTPEQRGRFLHPVEHGKAESQGVDYETRQKQRRYASLGPRGSPVG
jgi:hypothetical protein